MFHIPETIEASPNKKPKEILQDGEKFNPFLLQNGLMSLSINWTNTNMAATWNNVSQVTGIWKP